MARSRRTKPKPSKKVETSLPPDVVDVPLRVDWRDYHERFKQQHGLWWVEHENRLLFPDGWSCASDDYAGPYWPPPADLDELEALMRVYWRRRYSIVTARRDSLEADIQYLRRVQRDMPLDLSVVRQTVVQGDDGTSFIVMREPQPVPWNDKVERLKWLINDAERCRRELLMLGVSV